MPREQTATTIVGFDPDCDYVLDGTADGEQIQAAIDALPATGGRVLLERGIYRFTGLSITSTMINNIELVGEGKGTILVPNANNNLINVVAPARRCRIADLQINNLDGSSTSQGGIFLDHRGKNGHISDIVLENLYITDMPYGIHSRVKASDADNAIQGGTFQSIRIRKYTTVGMQLFNFFDSRFVDVMCVQKSAAANNGFRLDSSYNSGSTFLGCTALGAGGGTVGAGWYLDDVIDVWFYGCLGDTFRDGWYFTDVCNRVHLIGCKGYASTRDGARLEHTSGTVRLTDFWFQACAGAGINDTGAGGTVEIVPGVTREMFDWPMIGVGVATVAGLALIAYLAARRPTSFSWSVPQGYRV